MSSKPATRRMFWLAIKILGTGLFIALIARKVDFSALLPVIRQCQWEWFFASIFLQYGAAGLNAIRWRMLWPLPGLPLHKYLYFVFLGYFFNAFLPSAALSDAVRVLAFGRKYGNIQENIGVNLLARAMGACAQILVAGAFALIYFREWKDLRLPFQLQWNTSALGALALLMIVAAAAWFTRAKWRRWRWTQVMLAVLANKNLAMRTFLLSLFLQIVLAGGIFTLYYSLHPETRFWHMALFPLLIQIGLLLPLTVGGVGMREYLSLIFFSDIAGMPADVVLGVSLLGYIPFLLMAFTGGGWMLFRQIGNGATEKTDRT